MIWMFPVWCHNLLVPALRRVHRGRGRGKQASFVYTKSSRQAKAIYTEAQFQKQTNKQGMIHSHCCCSWCSNPVPSPHIALSSWGKFPSSKFPIICNSCITKGDLLPSLSFCIMDLTLSPSEGCHKYSSRQMPVHNKEPVNENPLKCYYFCSICSCFQDSDYFWFFSLPSLSTVLSTIEFCS